MTAHKYIAPSEARLPPPDAMSLANLHPLLAPIQLLLGISSNSRDILLSYVRLDVSATAPACHACTGAHSNTQAQTSDAPMALNPLALRSGRLDQAPLPDLPSREHVPPSVFDNIMRTDFLNPLKTRLSIFRGRWAPLRHEMAEIRPDLLLHPC